MPGIVGHIGLADVEAVCVEVGGGDLERVGHFILFPSASPGAGSAGVWDEGNTPFVDLSRAKFTLRGFFCCAPSRPCCAQAESGNGKGPGEGALRVAVMGGLVGLRFVRHGPMIQKM
jgi:hypothetical protein